jgi:putative transposase
VAGAHDNGSIGQGCIENRVDSIWNLGHLRRTLAEYESFYNEHRPRRALGQAAPPRPLPDNVVDLDHFRVTRKDRIGGILHEYHIAS